MDVRERRKEFNKEMRTGMNLNEFPNAEHFITSAEQLQTKKYRPSSTGLIAFTPVVLPQFTHVISRPVLQKRTRTQIHTRSFRTSNNRTPYHRVGPHPHPHTPPTRTQTEIITVNARARLGYEHYNSRLFSILF